MATLRCLERTCAVACNANTVSIDDGDDFVELHEEVDDAAMQPVPQAQTTPQLTVKQWITYGPSFSVPTFYFACYDISKLFDVHCRNWSLNFPLSWLTCSSRYHPSDLSSPPQSDRDDRANGPLTRHGRWWSVPLAIAGRTPSSRHTVLVPTPMRNADCHLPIITG